MDLVLVLHNIRSAHNVGSILRSADGFGVKRVIFSGYTPRMDDERVLPYLREKLNKQIAKTALGAERYVEKYASDDIKRELSKLKKEGFSVVGLENNLKTEKPVFKMKNDNFSEVCSALRKYGKRGVALVLGEEVNGIDYSLYDIIDAFLEISMKGRKESFNVSVAAGVAMFFLAG